MVRGILLLEKKNTDFWLFHEFFLGVVRVRVCVCDMRCVKLLSFFFWFGVVAFALFYKNTFVENLQSNIHVLFLSLSLGFVFDLKVLITKPDSNIFYLCLPTATEGHDRVVN